MLPTEDTGSDPALDLARSMFADLYAGDEPETAAGEPQPEATEEVAAGADDAEASTEQADAEAESQPEEQSEEPAPEAPELIPVVVDGVEQKVTLEELRKGYSRQQDYTRKTMELADKRKSLEADATEVRTAKEKSAQSLAQLEAALKSLTPEEPDWNKLQSELDPGEFAAQYIAFDQHKQRMALIAKQREEADAAVREERAKDYAKYVSAEQEKLFTAIPEWRDTAKRNAEGQKIAAFAESMGLKREVLAQTADAVAIQLLRMAYLYSEAEKKRPAVRETIERVKTATPGAPKAPAAKKSAADAAAARLAKTGSVRDAADAFGQFLD